MQYEEPTVVDYGDLLDLTAATGLFGTEDGASKVIPFHHGATAPASPSARRKTRRAASRPSTAVSSARPPRA